MRLLHDFKKLNLTRSVLFMAVSILLLSVFPCALAKVEITMSMQEELHLGDASTLSYTLLADEDRETTISVYQSCDGNVPQDVLNEQPLHLVAHVPYEGTYPGFIIDEEIDEQSCSARIRLGPPTFEEKSVSFKIIVKERVKQAFTAGTGPGSSYFQTMYVRGDQFLVENSEGRVALRVIAPSGKIQEGNPIILDEIGTYKVDVTATSPGKRPAKTGGLLSVVQEESLPPLITSCNEDGVCNSHETRKSCPQDCRKKVKEIMEAEALVGEAGRVAYEHINDQPITSTDLGFYVFFFSLLIASIILYARKYYSTQKQKKKYKSR